MARFGFSSSIHQTSPISFYSKNIGVGEELLLKSTQYKKLAPNALRFTYQNLKSCKPLEKNKKNTSKC